MSPEFVFENTKPTISNAELLDDIRRVAEELGATSLPKRLYEAHGRFSIAAIQGRFGSWNAAAERVGLTPAGRRDISEEELFENLRNVWVALGRQPRKREMVKPRSRYTHDPYSQKYGGWLDAVRAFLKDCDRYEKTESTKAESAVARGPRDPSLRLRFLVLRRDSFRCRHCGASPAISAGVELEVDHIVAWSQGGATAFANLQTLCSRCNEGKSNVAESGSG